jgi:KDO2-lipid IV(A) lauroyltransferase
MKWLFFKLAFLYPRIYAFFSYYRKKDRKRECEEKVKLFYDPHMDPQSVKRIVQGIFEVRGLRKLQRYLIPHIDHRFIRQFVTIEGLDILDRAVATKRGIILISGHIGTVHVGFNILRALGYEIHLLKEGNPANRRSTRFRHFDPNELTILTHDAPLSDDAKERILGILRSGGIIFYTADSRGGKKKVEVSFLGRKMSFPSGMLHFARKTNAIVLPFIHLYRHGKIRLIFEEPIDGDWKQGEKDYRRIMGDFAKLLEYYIRTYPESYRGLYGPTILDEYYRYSER